MPSVSKIPKCVNDYAVKCAYQIRNMHIEYAKGIDFERDIIKCESEFVKGNRRSVAYPPPKSVNAPKDIFIHNHPSSSEINFIDIEAALSQNMKKIFASTPKGYTSIDFTTAKKSKIEMQNWIKNFNRDSEIFYWELWRKTKEIGSEAVQIEKDNYEYKKLKEFAKFSGATFSVVKWNDYMHLNKLMA